MLYPYFPQTLKEIKCIKYSGELPELPNNLEDCKIYNLIVLPPNLKLLRPESLKTVIIDEKII